MYFPQNGDFIDIHVHGGTPSSGIFILESLMAHESKIPAAFGIACASVVIRDLAGISRITKGKMI